MFLFIDTATTEIYTYGHPLSPHDALPILNAKDPLVAEAKEFGVGAETGIDIPGEAPGRIADRTWKKQYYESQKDYYCDLAKNPPQDASAFLKKFSREFCIEGFAYSAGEAANFPTGQGDHNVTPLHLACASCTLLHGAPPTHPRLR